MQDIKYIPSNNPGAFERHLLRKDNNPLFGNRKTTIDNDSLMQAQKKDHEILEQFMLDFREVMSLTVAFKPNEESDVILEVKDKLDKLYATSVSVADDQSRIRESIKKLINVIMQSVRKGADNDAHALQELDQEDMAREANFAFLESNLVADILDPDSPIKDQDLVPTLLSANKDDLALANQLFDREQLTYILTEAETLLNKLDSEGHDIKQAAENFIFIEGYKQFMEQQTP